MFLALGYIRYTCPQMAFERTRQNTYRETVRAGRSHLRTVTTPVVFRYNPFTQIPDALYRLEPGCIPSVATLHFQKRSAHVNRVHIQSFHRRGQFSGGMYPTTCLLRTERAVFWCWCLVVNSTLGWWLMISNSSRPVFPSGQRSCVAAVAVRTVTECGTEYFGR